MSDVPILTAADRESMQMRAEDSRDYAPHGRWRQRELASDVLSLLAALAAVEEESARRLSLADNEASRLSRCLERLAAMEAARDAACEHATDLSCFSCGVRWKPSINKEKCDQAHRETWGHEWVSERVKTLTAELVTRTADRDWLRDLLRPFAEYVQHLPADEDDTMAYVDLADCRRAAAGLAASEGRKEGG